MWHICKAEEQDKDSQRLVPRNPQEVLKRQRNSESSLNSDTWAGDAWTGSKFNILTVIIIVSLLAPVLGLVFAWQTYGVYWG